MGKNDKEKEEEKAFYVVKGDTAVTVPRALSSTTDRDTGETVYEHQSAIYLPGSVLSSDQVSPVVQKLVEDGDPHTASILEKVDEEQANKMGGVTVEEPQIPEVAGPETASPGRVLVDGAALAARRAETEPPAEGDGAAPEVQEQQAGDEEAPTGEQEA